MGVTETSATDVWAVGYYFDNAGQYQYPLIEHFDGLRWSLVSSPNAPVGEGRLLSVTATGATDAWAVGYQWAVDSGRFKPLTEHWDGQQWNVVASPDPSISGAELFGVYASAQDDAWAVGYATNSNPQPMIQHWDGQQWNVVASPSTPGRSQLNAITAVAPNDIWATGFLTYGTLLTLTEHWAGSSGAWWRARASQHRTPTPS